MLTALAIAGMVVLLSAPEFWTIMGGPALSVPTAVFESPEAISQPRQEQGLVDRGVAMITRDAADLLNKVLRVAFGISGRSPP